MNDVIIGIPHAGVVKAQMAFSLAQLLSRDREADKRVRSGVIGVGGPYILTNTNTIAASFLKTEAEYLWLVEWDHELRLETLYALLAAQKPIIGALYFIDWHGYIRPCASDKPGFFWPLSSFKTNAVVPVTALGMGCTLVHRSVLEAMAARPDELCVPPYIWFDEDPEQAQDDPKVWRRHGHDVSFCLRAARAGFQPWLHTGVEAPHLDKGRTLDLKTYLAQEAVKTK